MKKRALFLACMICFMSSLGFSEDRQNKTVVYADVVGDILHKGHIEFFKKAREFGDYLIVGVLGDESAESYKRRPILNVHERAAMIQACKYVDEVIVDCPLRLTEELIQEMNISYVVHGDDFTSGTPEADALLHDQYSVALEKGIFRSVPYTEGVSTSDIIKRISTRYAAGEFRK